MTKTEALRQALSDLGSKAKPLQLKDHIKSKFGIEMSTAHISSTKSMLLKTGGRKGRPGRKPKAAAAPSAPARRDLGGISLDDIKAVKELADRIGADRVRELADLLSR